MGDLILNSLEIRNFRGFQHLTIERLGRVNLIVGKNNIGKSSLLEALQLYAQRGVPTLIWQFLRLRDELNSPRVTERNDRSEELERLLSSLKYLFYGRKDIKDQLTPIQIGRIDSSDETLHIIVNWYAEEMDEQGRIKRQLLEPNQYSEVDNPVPRFTVQMGKEFKVDYPLNPSSLALSRLVPSELKELSNVFVGANGLSRNQAGKLWDLINLRPLDADVLNSLQIIAPGVEAYSFIGGGEAGRIPIVRIAGIDEPLPIGSLGNGMQRMLGISLALANTGGGILLIDEIENGIHYSVQSELWRLIFRLAHSLNVQVFATTHSEDCIKGFQKAAQEQKQEEGVLIQLGYKRNVVNATLFNEEELGIAVRQQIEVR